MPLGISTLAAMKVKGDMKSRMKREFHVRFCERLRGKFPRSTRPKICGCFAFYPQISSATLRARSISRSSTATCAPDRAKCRAVASPSPDAPPVTTAIDLPSSIRQPFRSSRRVRRRLWLALHKMPARALRCIMRCSSSLVAPRRAAFFPRSA